MFRPSLMVVLFLCVFLTSLVAHAFGPTHPLTVPVVLVGMDKRAYVLPAVNVSAVNRGDGGPVQVIFRGEADLSPGHLAYLLTDALPTLGIDPAGLTVTIYSSNRLSVSGPSWQAALIVGVAAFLSGRTLDSGYVLTGEVLPHGQIGEVGDLGPKSQAADAARLTLLYPAATPNALPMPHKAVGTLVDAYALMTR